MKVLAQKKPEVSPQQTVKTVIQRVRAAQSKRFAPLRKSLREIAKADIDMVIDFAKNISEKIDEKEE